MKPVLPEPVAFKRELQERRERLNALRPGWLCPKCGSAHSPTTDTCPEGRRRANWDIIR